MQTSAPDKDAPFSEADLREAHRLQGIHEPFERAIEVDLYRRLNVARAHRERTQRWLASLPPAPRCLVRRVRLDTQGEVAGWCTQAVMGPRTETPQLTLPLNPT
jgi:hypothetical protein